MTGFTVRIFFKNIYLGHIFVFKTVLHIGLKPKNTQVACRDTPDTNEARSLKGRQSSVDVPANRRVDFCSLPTAVRIPRCARRARRRTLDIRATGSGVKLKGPKAFYEKARTQEGKLSGAATSPHPPVASLPLARACAALPWSWSLIGAALVAWSASKGAAHRRARRSRAWRSVIGPLKPWPQSLRCGKVSPSDARLRNRSSTTTLQVRDEVREPPQQPPTPHPPHPKHHRIITSTKLSGEGCPACCAKR